MKIWALPTLKKMRSGAEAWRKEVRISHWAKNMLVFVPWMTAHKFSDSRALVNAFFAFFSFCLCASGGYVWNDLRDRSDDRRHPQKQYRPIAAGALSASQATRVAIFLIAGGLLLTVGSSHSFLFPLISYVLLSVLYSWHLKNILIVDVIVLAVLYTVRIFAGAMAIDVPISPWLLAFSLFLFLSLALVKRYAALSNAAQRDPDGGLRSYRLMDAPLLASLGTSSGYIAVLVFVLYVDSQAVTPLYEHPQRLWWIGLLLLYWVSRIWLQARRGEVDEDPIRFALQDWSSYAVGIFALFLLWLAGAK